MKCKSTFVSLCAAFLLGISAVGISGWGINSAVIHPETAVNSISCFPNHSPAAPTEIFLQSAANQADSQFMARLFQILFILFIISPPLIVLMLFLIWQELKKRNKSK